MNVKMMIALVVLGSLVASPVASAHIEECAEGRYIEIPSSWHSHETGCEDPDTLLAFVQMTTLA